MHEICTLRITGCTSKVSSLVIDDQFSILGAGTCDGSIHLWNLNENLHSDVNPDEAQRSSGEGLEINYSRESDIQSTQGHINQLSHSLAEKESKREKEHENDNRGTPLEGKPIEEDRVLSIPFVSPVCRLDPDQNKNNSDYINDINPDFPEGRSTNCSLLKRNREGFSCFDSSQYLRIYRSISAHRKSIQRLIYGTKSRLIFSVGNEGVVKVWNSLNILSLIGGAKDYEQFAPPRITSDQSSGVIHGIIQGMDNVLPREHYPHIPDSSRPTRDTQHTNKPLICLLSKDDVKSFTVASLCSEEDVIAVGTDDGYIRVWDITHIGDLSGNGISVKDPHPDKFPIASWKAHPRTVTGLNFSLKSRTHLWSCSHDSKLCLWHTFSGDLLCRVVGHIGGITGLCISSIPEEFVKTHNPPVLETTPLASLDSDDRYFIATGGEDSTIRLWSLVDLTKKLALDSCTMTDGYDMLHHCLTGHDAPITCLSFRSDGKLLASGDENGNVFIWEMSMTSPSLAFSVPVCTAPRMPVNALCFSIDNTSLFVAHKDITYYCLPSEFIPMDKRKFINKKGNNETRYNSNPVYEFKRFLANQALSDE